MSVKPDYLQHKLRVRQRYEKDGLTGFAEYEVLELILSYSIIRRDTKTLAKRLLEVFGNLTSVLNAPQEMLVKVEGVGERTAVLLKLFKDVHSYHLRSSLLNTQFITSAAQMFEYLHAYYKGKSIEEFKIVYLSGSNLILHEETLFSGTINEAKIYIRRIIERVLLYHAANVIIAHNHPGGSVKPSKDDIAITQKIKSALKLVEIGLLDHLIICENDFYSFAKEGKL